MTVDESYENWKKNREHWPIKHRPECHYNKRISHIPIKKCHCDCYERGIFTSAHHAAMIEAHKEK